MNLRNPNFLGSAVDGHVAAPMGHAQAEPSYSSAADSCDAQRFTVMIRVES